MSEPELEPWEPEALAWLAELTGGTVEHGDRVRIVRAETTAAAFVSLLRRAHGERMPSEAMVLLRARVETAAGDARAEAEPGPFRSAASPRRRVRGRPQLALGERFFTGGTLVEPDRPLPLSDPRLEGICFTSDGSDAEVLEVLGAASLQGRLGELFALRCSSVSINEGGEWLFVRFEVQPLAAEEGERVRAMVDAFVALANALPLFVGPARTPSFRSRLARGFRWLSPLAGIPAMIAGVSWRPTLEIPVALVGVSASLFALGLLVGWLVLRRKRLTGRKLTRSLFGLGLRTALGLPSVCLGLGLLANGCDPGALERRSAEVLSKHRHKSRHYLDVKELRPGANGATVATVTTVTAGYDLWERTRPGARVVLVVGPGRLGWPWLARVEEAPR